MNWEETFTQWAKPPSDTEKAKCENARNTIEGLVSGHDSFINRSITTLVQGSYGANTNVRMDSDVDICILCSNSIFFDLPEGKTAADYNITTPAPYSFGTYKDELNTALIERFGQSGVTRGNKAFDVHSNSYRVDADAVPAFEYRVYFGNNSGDYYTGVAFIDEGTKELIYNFPRQALENGKSKNTATGHRYKKVVRVLKCLRNKMQDDGITRAMDVPSFLVECLVYSTPNVNFQNDLLNDDVESVLQFLVGNLTTDETCSECKEVNGIKPLFFSSQPWDRSQAFKFAWAALQYI